MAGPGHDGALGPEIAAMERPALAGLILAMQRLSRVQRVEVVRMGPRGTRRPTAADRRLAREAKAEAKRLAAVAGG